jgi:hypothetical protein
LTSAATAANNANGSNSRFDFFCDRTGHAASPFFLFEIKKLTGRGRNLSLDAKFMANIPPSSPGSPGAPTGPEPMKKTTGKVAPKKETVRITLPPKPSAAPTIKLPTLPPGGPTGAPSVIPLSSAAKAPPPVAAPRATAAPAAAPRATTAPAVQRPAPAAAPTVGTLDKILAIAAMVAALFAVGSALYLMFGIQYGS